MIGRFYEKKFYIFLLYFIFLSFISISIAKEVNVKGIKRKTLSLYEQIKNNGDGKTYIYNKILNLDKNDVDLSTVKAETTKYIGWFLVTYKDKQYWVKRRDVEIDYIPNTNIAKDDLCHNPEATIRAFGNECEEVKP